MNARRLTLAILCALGGALAFSSASALALLNHPYVSQLTGFGDPTGVAVGSGGALYVADSGKRVVERLDASGAPLSFSASKPYIEGARLTGTPSGPFELPQGVAVNDATGKIYVSDGTAQAVDVFSASGEYLQQFTGAPVSAPVSGNFKDPDGLTVDQATGELYVTDPHGGVVDVFNATDEYVTQFGSGTLSSSYAESVAVNELTGAAYISDSGSDTVDPFSSASSFLPPAWAGHGTPDGSFGGGYVHVGIDPSSGDVYVASTQDEAVYEFKASLSEEYADALTGTPAGPFASPQAVTVAPGTGAIYVADASGAVDVFGPAVVLPDVATEAASETTRTSTLLDGTVNPDGAANATCQFAWGTSPTLEHVAPCAGTVPNGGNPVQVHAALSGLTPDTTYYYRLQASNANGSNSGEIAQDRSFKTFGPPHLEGEGVSDVASGSATLNAQIDPNNTPTYYYFQYGTTASYGTDLPALEGPMAHGVILGSSAGEKNVDVHLQGLATGVTYHYRVVVVGEPNPGEYEVIPGADQAFTTQSMSGTSALPDGRAWELVTPPYKQGAGLIAVGNEQGADIQAAADGSALTYAATSPFVENPAGSRSLEVTQVFSDRTDPGSWATNDISTAHDEGATGIAIGHSAEYKLFSSDLSFGAVEPEVTRPCRRCRPTRKRRSTYAPRAAATRRW